MSRYLPTIANNSRIPIGSNKYGRRLGTITRNKNSLFWDFFAASSEEEAKAKIFGDEVSEVFRKELTALVVDWLDANGESFDRRSTAMSPWLPSGHLQVHKRNAGVLDAAYPLVCRWMGTIATRIESDRRSEVLQ